MKTSNPFLFILFLTTLSCASLRDNNFMTDNDGIIVEKFDSTNTDENKYNRDNKIYSVGTKFIYSYEHIGADQKRYLIGKEREPQNKTGKWKFIAKDKTNDSIITKVSLQAMNGNAFKTMIPDYNQTNILYDFLNDKNVSLNKEITGVIENQKNVWIHPPRTSLFAILELNPFPYITHPYSVGDKWKWKLSIGDHWSNENWLQWKGRIENDYLYEIIGKKKINTKLGAVECLVIRSIANSRLGQTHLVAYFNKQYGFVRLEYTNIDGSKTYFQLEEKFRI